MMISLMVSSLVTCYVGSNIGAPDRQSIHVLSCDTETGASRLVQSVKGFRGTTYFQLAEDGSCLYTVIDESRGSERSSAVIRFELDGGVLGNSSRVATLPCEAPCHVSLTPDGRRIAFAAYGSATCGTVGVDGGGLEAYTFPDDAMGPNKLRQQKAFAHQTFMSKGELGVVDLGCDRIRFFDPATMKPTATPDIRFDAGDGPRHAIWSGDGRFLFVVCELSSSVCSFAWDGGKFTRVGKWSMLPKDYSRWEADGRTLNTKAAAIKLTADGKLLMASNRGHDSIAFFAVGEDGRLTLKNIAKLAGRFPRDFELMPGEKFMVVGHKLSDEIQIYAFDREACTLKPVGAPIKCWQPLCFKFRQPAG